MTPQEANIVRWLELVGGMASDTAIANQFGIDPGALGVILGSLKRHLCLEQDRRHLRVTTVGEDKLREFDDQSKYVPFEGQGRW